MTEPKWLSEREQRAWRGWIDASRRILAGSDRQLKADSGLTTDDYEVLVRLSEATDRRMRMSDLAESVTNSPVAALAADRSPESRWCRRARAVR